MWRVDVPVWRPFLHRRRIHSDGELQAVRFVPDLNRFDKRAGRKHAMPLRTGAAAKDFSTDRVRNSGTKKPLMRGSYFGKSDYLLPDLLRRSIDLNRRPNHKRLGRRCDHVLDPLNTRNDQKEDAQI